MAKSYFKTVPEVNGCEGCCADDNESLCEKLIDTLECKTGKGCYENKVIFKFVKREEISCETCKHENSSACLDCEPKNKARGWEPK